MDPIYVDKQQPMRKLLEERPGHHWNP